MENIKNAVKIAKHKYSASLYTVCWIFDQSSCHRECAKDAVNAKRMNIRPGVHSREYGTQSGLGECKR